MPAIQHEKRRSNDPSNSCWLGFVSDSSMPFPESKKRPSFNEIFEELKSHNFDMFSEENDKKLTSKQQSMKQAIESRVLQIEAFEYQHQ